MAEATTAMAVRTSPFILLILLLAAACCRPTGDFHLVSTETAREEGGAFRFEIPVTDSGLVVTTSLAARLVTRLGRNGRCALGITGLGAVSCGIRIRQ